MSLQYLCLQFTHSAFISCKIKYNQLQACLKQMQGISVANQILDHIVKEGKKQMKDKYLNKEIVPPFVATKTQDFNFEAIIHGGYQIQNNMRKDYFSMRKDKQAEASQKNKLGPSRAKLEKSKIDKSIQSSPVKDKGQLRSHSLSGLNSRRLKSVGFNSPGPSPRNQQKQKQNDSSFIKLQEDHGKRITIGRVIQRETMQEERMRNQKANQMMKQYQQKKANQLFQKEKQQDRIYKEKVFREHTSQGKDHKYYFHEGEAILYKDDQPQKRHPASQTRFMIEQDEGQQILQGQRRQHASPYFKRNNPKVTQNRFTNTNEHHKIRSAKGQVFASSVLKTINLSRISLNETLRNLQDEQFMKRNDLFNNNHARQTTSIPYLLPKSGTFYTELSTNQMVGSTKIQSEDKCNYSFKSETTRNPNSNRRKSHFQPHRHQELFSSRNSEKKVQAHSKNQDDSFREFSGRPVRTAQTGFKRVSERDKRPQTSVLRGRITKANQSLASALLN